MASLTHVCMWSEKGWRRISAHEAARLHPRGGVSAHSGLFMCELCGQYVLLTEDGLQVRHFRHSSSEKSKDCPERTNGGGSLYYTFNAGEHELPIRIKNISNSSFQLEIGFIQIPSDVLTSKLRIEIKPDSYGSKSFVYMRERLNSEGITYLSIGDVPSEKYNLNISGASERIFQFWPKTIQGIDPNGTVFDAATGKRLVYDADVAVGKKYYLLRRGIPSSMQNSHVSAREISRKTILRNTWHLYEIVAKDYDEDSARFFLDFHCRLTEQLISIQPVWPVYVENPYLVKHNQKRLVMHLTGNAPTMQVFPYAYIKKWDCNNGTVIEIDCNERQQLISAGHTKVLQYTYFWKEPLNRLTEEPVAIIKDLKGETLENGEYNKLPESGVLRCEVPYDGLLNIKHNNVVVDKRKLQANTPIEIDGITWNMELEIRVGLDIVWKANFKREEKKQNLADEKQILKRLTSYNGGQIKITHTMGSLASKLSGYPLIKQWLYKCIRSGYMNEKAYYDLQTWIRSGTLNEVGNKGGSL